MIAHALRSGGNGNALGTDQAGPVVLAVPGRAG
jgi:hypothetical protein